MSDILKLSDQDGPGIVWLTQLPDGRMICAKRVEEFSKTSVAGDPDEFNWLDLGNNAASGQYVLGQPLNGINRRRAERLRTVAELYPEIADPTAGEAFLNATSGRMSALAIDPARWKRSRRRGVSGGR